MGELLQLGNRHRHYPELGQIDVHMVTHEQANRGLSFSRFRRALARSWRAAAFTLPWAILAITAALVEPTLDVGGKSAISSLAHWRRVVGAGTAALSGLLSGTLLVDFLMDPRYSFAVDNLSNAVTIATPLGVAMAIAVPVDAAASRAREARRASQGRAALTVRRVGTARADLNTSLERVREADSQRAVRLGATSTVALRRSRAWAKIHADGGLC